MFEKIKLVCLKNDIHPSGGSRRLYPLTIGKQYTIDISFEFERDFFWIRADDNIVDIYPMILFNWVFEPLELSADKWWWELETLIQMGILPGTLGGKLKALISATLKSGILPDARTFDVDFAKKLLKGGISIGQQNYDLAVFVPEDAEERRKFFVLIPKWIGGKLHRLEEM